MSEDDPGQLFAPRRARRARQQTQDDGTTPMTKEEQDRAVAILSVERHIAELEPHPNVTLRKDDPLSFTWTIRPTTGLWKDGIFEFKVTIPNNFPFSSPHVVLTTPIWHPNIDLDGKPCVSVLQKGWKPTYTLGYVMYGLLFLFDSPNSEDPLNIQAAAEMRSDMTQFKQHVRDYTLRAIEQQRRKANYKSSEGF